MIPTIDRQKKFVVVKEIEAVSVEEACNREGPGVVDAYPAPDDLWSEDPDCPRRDWQNQVFKGDTNLGYWQWVQHEKEATLNRR